VRQKIETLKQRYREIKTKRQGKRGDTELEKTEY
jgi:hypothetical protein